MATTFHVTQELDAGEGDPRTQAVTPSGAGRLLVAFVNERSGTAHANHTVTDNSGGAAWTKISGHDQEISDSNARQASSIWVKETVSTTGFTITADDGTANSKRLAVFEFEARTDSVTPITDRTWTFRQKSSADSGTGFTSPQSSGTTASVSAGDLLLIGGGFWRNGNFANIESAAWTNGLTQEFLANGGSNVRSQAMGWDSDTAGGTYETELSWTENTSGSEVTCHLVVIELESGGGGAPATRRYSLTMTGVG